MINHRLCSAPILFDWWAPEGNIFHLPRFPIRLWKRYKWSLKHVLCACELRKSTFRNAGKGTFLAESARAGKILFKYGGRRISFPDADRLAQLVRRTTNLKIDLIDS